MPTKFPFHRCISRICILSMGGLSHSNSKRKISLGDPLLRIEILRNLFYFFANFSIKKAYRISYGCTHDNDIECEKRSPKCIFDLSFCMLIFFEKKGPNPQYFIHIGCTGYLITDCTFHMHWYAKDI